MKIVTLWLLLESKTSCFSLFLLRGDTRVSDPEAPLADSDIKTSIGLNNLRNSIKITKFTIKIQPELELELELESEGRVRDSAEMDRVEYIRRFIALKARAEEVRIIRAFTFIQIQNDHLQTKLKAPPKKRKTIYF